MRRAQRGSAASKSTSWRCFAASSNATCTTELAATSGGQVKATVNGPGFYTSAPPVVVNTAGTYYWRASYRGDANNDPVPLTKCGDTGESTVVNAGGKL